MLIEATVKKLQEMRLTAMAKEFKAQLADPKMALLSFEDRFSLLVDYEWTTRKNNHLQKLTKQAKFSVSNACVEDVEYFSERNLNPAHVSKALLPALSLQKNITCCFLALQVPAKPTSPVHSEWQRYGNSSRFVTSAYRNC